METKRLSFRSDTGANPRPASGVSTDTPGSGSDVYPVARQPPESRVVPKPESRASRSTLPPRTTGAAVPSGAIPARASSLPPPPPGLLSRRPATPVPPPFMAPPPAFRPSGVITQLEVPLAPLPTPERPAALPAAMPLAQLPAPSPLAALPAAMPLAELPAPPPLAALPAPPPLPREARSLLFEEPRPSTVDYAEVRHEEPRTTAIVLRDGVRRADVRDADVLAAIQAMAREHAFERGLLPRPTELDFDQLVRAWRFRVSSASRARTFLALRSGEPAGFVSAGPGRAGYPWEGEIYAAHVHPRFWSNRVAENLAAAAFDHLVQRGFSVVRIWVTVTNTEVLSRLGGLGFRPVAQRFHPQHGGLEEAFVRRLA